MELLSVSEDDKKHDPCDDACSHQDCKHQKNLSSQAFVPLLDAHLVQRLYHARFRPLEVVENVIRLLPGDKRLDVELALDVLADVCILIPQLEDDLQVHLLS